MNNILKKYIFETILFLDLVRSHYEIFNKILEEYHWHNPVFR